MNFATAEELLIPFSRSLKIDILPICALNNKSAHMEYLPVYCKKYIYASKNK